MHDKTEKDQPQGKRGPQNKTQTIALLHHLKQNIFNLVPFINTIL